MMQALNVNCLGKCSPRDVAQKMYMYCNHQAPVQTLNMCMFISWYVHTHIYTFKSDQSIRYRPVDFWVSQKGGKNLSKKGKPVSPFLPRIMVQWENGMSPIMEVSFHLGENFPLNHDYGRKGKLINAKTKASKTSLSSLSLCRTEADRNIAPSTPDKGCFPQPKSAAKKILHNAWYHHIIEENEMIRNDHKHGHQLPTTNMFFTFYDWGTKSWHIIGTSWHIIGTSFPLDENMLCQSAVLKKLTLLRAAH